MEVIPHKLFGNIRAIVAEGIPWFCGKDVATALSYAKPPNAIKRHVSEKQKCIYETLREKLPAAIAFKDWVCEDVLPTIRKYGTYTCWKEVKNETQLHYQLCDFARKAYPKVRITPGLGENQDSNQKRLDSYCKGYQRGQPDLIVHQRSGNFSGLVIELKTPRGTGVVSPEQQQRLDDMARAGYRVLLSSSLEESIKQLNAFMQNARICRRHCGSSFASERTLRRHSEKYHPT